MLDACFALALVRCLRPAPALFPNGEEGVVSRAAVVTHD